MERACFDTSEERCLNAGFGSDCPLELVDSADVPPNSVVGSHQNWKIGEKQKQMVLQSEMGCQVVVETARAV